MLARDWKQLYLAERTRLGRDGLRNLIKDTARGDFSPSDAVIFPHTKLADSGHLIAGAALQVVRSGCTRALALGVLHGGRAMDAEDVKLARAGDATAIEKLRRIHGPGVPGDQGVWTEEFSLDSFIELLTFAAELERCAAPEVIARYPFLTGQHPETLPGIDELRRLVAEGCTVVATTDPIHHGAEYGTPAHELRNPLDVNSVASARRRIEEQFAFLGARDYAGFAMRVKEDRSDFRDNGPVLRELFGNTDVEFKVRDLSLVDYSDMPGSKKPSWVAAALAVARPKK